MLTSNKWNRFATHLLHSVNLTASLVADLLVFGTDAVLNVCRRTRHNLLVILRLGVDSFNYAVSCRPFTLQHNAAWSRAVQHFCANAGFALEVRTALPATTCS